jgi:hypothetical protein
MWDGTGENTRGRSFLKVTTLTLDVSYLQREAFDHPDAATCPRGFMW